MAEFYSTEKLIEASLIRALAKWSPQNAEAMGEAAKGEMMGIQTRNKAYFPPLGCIP